MNAPGAAGGRTFRFRTVAVGILGCWLIAGGSIPGAAAKSTEDLQQGFVHPPDSARPWVYWFWMDGNVTQAGITADLEAMQRVGIGGVLLLDVTQGIPPGPVRLGSPQWHALFKHAIAEAGRLGLQVSVHNAPGWTGSGGPWIKPELAMQKVIASKTNFTGPAHFSGPLPPLQECDGHCRAIATLAFPALAGEGGPVPGFPPKKVSVSATATIDAAKLFDGNPATFITLPAPKSHRPQYLQLEFAEPFTAAILKLAGAGSPQSFQGVLEISDDGHAFRTVREFSNAGSTLALPFEQISARFFRVLFTQADARLSELKFSELELAPSYRIALHQTKAGLGQMPSLPAPPVPLPIVPPQAVISPVSIIDLSGQTDADGRLTWEVPKGQWTVLRLAHTPTGMMNHPAQPEGSGLECDKLSREAVEAHFSAFLGPLLAEVGVAAGRSLIATHIDSWEIGYQNWTPRFLEEFKQRRGYDPLHFLPAFTGRFVAGPEQSERFLWDVRRTIADLLADNYAGHLAELAHRHDLELSIEAYGSYGQGPFDELLYAGRADVPMTEFWLGTDDYSKVQLRSMPSAAHTCGKPIIAAEAFTSYPASAKWQEHPFALKPLGDAAFCEGVNRLVFHRYAHQPWLDRRPGMTMGPSGIHYERTQTWWEQSRAWHEYLARCQFLLQRGLFVADLCYLTPEGAYNKPPSRDQLDPLLPPGYNYDLAAPEVVLTRMSVREGQLVLPDGMSYRALVLPPGDFITPKLLRKIKQLVEAGATVVGPRPAKSPSLTDYPQCDAEVKQLADELWGPCDGKNVKEHRAGNGTIIWGKPLDQVLRASGAGPDFLSLTRTPGWPLRYIHRRIDDTEVYFVANANPQPILAECQFRVAGKQHEFWHPDTGQIELPAVWRQQDGHTRVQLTFDPAGSLFVVFRASSAGADPVVSLTRDREEDTSARLTFDAQGKLQLLAVRAGAYRAQTASGKSSLVEIKNLPAPIALTGKWELSFPPNSGAPDRVTLDRLSSWTDHPDRGVKYFSGAATYTYSFNLPTELLTRQRRLYLDLGQVQVLAELKVNGRNCGIFWKPPFQADITDAVKAGGNALEINVVNLWPNRLIGDEQLPEDCRWQHTAQSEYGLPLAEWPQWLLEGKPSPTGRLTFTTWKHWTKDSPLLESGLLGPVTLHFAERRSME